MRNTTNEKKLSSRILKIILFLIIITFVIYMILKSGEIIQGFQDGFNIQ
jgi:di/tricarboxylate transporter